MKQTSSILLQNSNINPSTQFNQLQRLQKQKDQQFFQHLRKLRQQTNLFRNEIVKDIRIMVNKLIQANALQFVSQQQLNYLYRINVEDLGKFYQVLKKFNQILYEKDIDRRGIGMQEIADLNKKVDDLRNSVDKQSKRQKQVEDLLQNMNGYIQQLKLKSYELTMTQQNTNNQIIDKQFSFKYFTGQDQQKQLESWKHRSNHYRQLIIERQQLIEKRNYLQRILNKFNTKHDQLLTKRRVYYENKHRNQHLTQENGRIKQDLHMLEANKEILDIAKLNEVNHQQVSLSLKVYEKWNPLKQSSQSLLLRILGSLNKNLPDRSLDGLSGIFEKAERHFEQKERIRQEVEQMQRRGRTESLFVNIQQNPSQEVQSEGQRQI